MGGDHHVAQDEPSNQQPQEVVEEKPLDAGIYSLAEPGGALTDIDIGQQDIDDGVLQAVEHF